MEWQPIDTAPKDGSDFLAYWPDQWDNDSWNIERTWFDGYWYSTPNDQEEHNSPWKPTHWQPMLNQPTT